MDKDFEEPLMVEWTQRCDNCLRWQRPKTGVIGVCWRDEDCGADTVSGYWCSDYVPIDVPPRRPWSWSRLWEWFR